MLLLLIALAMYSYSKLKGKSLLPTTGNKFQAFQDALPEGKPYNDPEWDAPVRPTPLRLFLRTSQQATIPMTM